jgi:hypothetical protein
MFGACLSKAIIHITRRMRAFIAAWHTRFGFRNAMYQDALTIVDSLSVRIFGAAGCCRHACL